MFMTSFWMLVQRIMPTMHRAAFLCSVLGCSHVILHNEYMGSRCCGQRSPTFFGVSGDIFDQQQVAFDLQRTCEMSPQRKQSSARPGKRSRSLYIITNIVNTHHKGLHQIICVINVRSSRSNWCVSANPNPVYPKPPLRLDNRTYDQSTESERLRR